MLNPSRSVVWAQPRGGDGEGPVLALLFLLYLQRFEIEMYLLAVGLEDGQEEQPARLGPLQKNSKRPILPVW